MVVVLAVGAAGWRGVVVVAVVGAAGAELTGVRCGGGHPDLDKADRRCERHVV